METDSQNKLTNIRLTRREAAAQRHRVTLSSFSRTVHRFILFSFVLSVVWFKSAWHLISTWRLSGRRESYQTWRSVQIRPSTAEICYLKELFMVGSFIKHDPDTTKQQTSVQFRKLDTTRRIQKESNQHWYQSTSQALKQSVRQVINYFVHQQPADQQLTGSYTRHKITIWRWTNWI